MDGMNETYHTNGTNEMNKMTDPDYYLRHTVWATRSRRAPAQRGLGSEPISLLQRLLDGKPAGCISTKRTTSLKQHCWVPQNVWGRLWGRLWGLGSWSGSLLEEKELSVQCPLWSLTGFIINEIPPLRTAVHGPASNTSLSLELNFFLDMDARPALSGVFLEKQTYSDVPRPWRDNRIRRHTLQAFLATAKWSRRSL